MDALRKVLEHIRKYLGRLGATQKLLIGSIAVILLMTLFIVTQYAGRSKLVDLMAADGQAETVAFLRASGIPAREQNGRVMVPPDSKTRALSSMAEAGKLPDDAAVLFNSLIDRQKWTNSREQNEQLYIVALQNELSRVISGFSYVKSATVILDAPRPVGIGAATIPPSGSATVHPRNGVGLTQPQVDAIAALVASARAGMDISNVRVIDGANGRQHTARRAEDFSASSYLEYQTAIENKTREKLLALLQGVPGVVVAVTAHVDIARENSQTTLYRSADEGGTVSLMASERTNTSTMQNAGSGAEPGLRSNVGADISTGSSAGSSTETSESTTEMENKVGSVVTQRIDPKGMPTHIAASVAVPRGYVVAVLKGGDENAEEPDEAAINAKFAEISDQITKSVTPHLKAEEDSGEVNVSMMPIDLPALPPGSSQAGLFGSWAGGGGSGGVLGLGEGLIDKIMLAVLGVVSLGLMFSMVRKAGKSVKLPTADELVGIPPPLEARSDVIGEADETDSPMAGIELAEGDMANQKMLEQVHELVKSNPQAAAKLVGRWVTPDA